MDEVTPSAIRLSSKDIDVTITGAGFTPIESGLFGMSKAFPEVIFTDEGRGISVTVTGDPDSTGTEMTATIPGSFREDAIGPIRVEVRHGGDQKEAQNKIEITELIITELRPDRGGPGTLVDVIGAGFSENSLENKVTFQGELSRSTAVVVQSSESQIRTVAPTDVVTGDVTVEVEAQISNGALFTVDLVPVVIAFGDNGFLNDDTYALLVDGLLVRAMAVPSRRVVVEIDLTPGTHIAVLRGITAPDNIGTYFISFEQGVLSVSGAPLTGSDLTAGVEKFYTIEVGETPTEPIAPLVDGQLMMQFE